MVQVSAGAFETAGLRGEDRMEDRCFILSPLQGPAPDTHLIGKACACPPCAEERDELCCLVPPLHSTLLLVLWACQQAQCPLIASPALFGCGFTTVNGSV